MSLVLPRKMPEELTIAWPGWPSEKVSKEAALGAPWNLTLTTATSGGDMGRIPEDGAAGSLLGVLWSS